MDNRPIGLFDSGFGGLTSVRALKRLMPEENFVYLGDNARVPYGTKPLDELRQIIRNNIAFLEQHDIKALIVACGTAYAAAHDIIDALPYPATGVIEPAARRLSELGTGGKPVGIIATQRSVDSGLYQKYIEQYLPGTKTVAVGCPKFVTLVESGRTSPDDEGVMEICKEYLTPIKEAGCGTIIHGCTHFGLLSSPIAAFLGEEVRQIEASACAVEYMMDYMKKNDICGTGAHQEFYTSGSTEFFDKMAPLFLGNDEKIGSVQVMQVEELQCLKTGQTK